MERCEYLFGVSWGRTLQSANDIRCTMVKHLILTPLEEEISFNKETWRKSNPVGLNSVISHLVWLICTTISFSYMFGSIEVDIV